MKGALRRRPCKVHGVLSDDDITTQNKCSKCANEWAREWKKNNRDKVNATNARSRERNPGIWDEAYKQAYQAKKTKLGTKVLNSMEISRRRGISIEEYEALFVKQNNKCAICEQPETKKNRSGQIARLTLDHNHANNKNRELLCHACNLGLGKFKDNIDFIKSAIAYLEHFKGAK